MSRSLRTILLVASLAAGACRRQPGPAAAAATPPRYVDSVVPPEVALARFRAGLVPPTGLVGGASSKDILVKRYIRALERGDTTGLAALTITRAEFAYFYYPTNPQAHPPYDLAPDLMWFLLQEHSRKGLLHAFEARGGGTLGYTGYACDEPAQHEGRNVVWPSCRVLRREGSGTVEERLFGPILERGARFKFLSLANKL